MARMLLILPLMVIAGCSDAAPPSSVGAARKVRIQLNWVPEPEFGGIYAAKIDGVFAEKNLDVEILKGGPDVPAVQLVASGKVEFGIAAADEVLAIREKGGDLVGLFAIFQTAPQGIMYHQARSPESLEKLLKAGGTLAVQPGLNYVKFLQKKYDMSGLTLVPYQGGVAQFLADPQLSQQVFVTAEPISARNAGAEVGVFLVADSGYNPYTAVVVTRRKLLDEQPTLVRDFVQAVRDGWTRYLTTPEPANAVMAQLNPSMDLPAMREASQIQQPLIDNLETAERGLGSMRKERWEELAQQLRDLGVIEKVPNVEECFVNLLQ